MSNLIQIHSVGSFGDSSGKLFISYTPDCGTVTLLATVPADKRKSDISVRVGIGNLRVLMEKLEDAVETARRAKLETATVKNEAGSLSLTVMNTKLLVPKTVIDSLKLKIESGQNDAVLREIRISFPFLKDEAVSEVALSVYKYFRPRV